MSNKLKLVNNIVMILIILLFTIFILPILVRVIFSLGTYVGSISRCIESGLICIK